MQAFYYLKTRNWSTLFGYALFIGMMSVGYFYNVSFVQLGLVDLGTRLVGLSEQQVATDMGLLALLTTGLALIFGFVMQRRGWSQRFFFKLRLAFGVVLLQTLLTIIAPHIRTEAGFLAWIVATSGALGIGVPVMFSMTLDLIPVRDRGYVAALITSIAYFAANVYATDWRIEKFSAQFVWIMLGGTAGMALLCFVRLPFIDQLLRPLAQQHQRPAFGRGRFVRRAPNGNLRASRKLYVLIILMFGIFFIDSLGFLRLIATPFYAESAWRSPEMGVHVFIAGTHVVAALIAGVLYSALNERHLFLWIFGIFALTHLMYSFSTQPIIPSDSGTLAMPMLYAIAVSLYTVVNFSLWADVSTPQNISLHAAFGVAVSGWAATFISTALAIRWQIRGLPMEQHLNIVGALSMLFFLALLVWSMFWSGGNTVQQTQPGERNSL